VSQLVLKLPGNACALAYLAGYKMDAKWPKIDTILYPIKTSLLFLREQ
jgi:uncharacterized membrane protein